MNKRGFTLIELLIVIAIIAILTAILFPIFALVKESARKTACLSGIRQLSQATLMYSSDWSGRLPQWCFEDGSYTWDTAISPNVRNRRIFSCSDNQANVGAQSGGLPPETVIRSYALPRNVSGLLLGAIPRPAKTVLLFEKGSQPLFSWGDSTGESFFQMWATDYRPNTYPHHEGKAFAFVDGHAGFWPLSSGPFEYWFDPDRYPKGYCGNLSGPNDLSNTSEPGANLPR